MTSKGRAASAIGMGIGGVLLLVWQVDKVGLPAIRDSIASVGIGFLGILALSLLRYAVRALAWTTLLGGGVPLWRALRATIAGDAIGNVTPLRLIASEPAKAMMLGHGVDPS